MTRALLLAAGYGKRLRPLTLRLPKPVVPVLNQPLAAYSLRLLAAAGVRRVAVNTHHLPWHIEQALGDGGSWGVEITYSREPEILGTGGAMVKLREFLSADGTFLVLNGDVICEPDLQALLEFHRRRGALATMVVRALQPGENYTPLEMDAEGRLVSFKDARLPPSGAVQRVMFCGIHAFDPGVFDFLPRGGFCCVNEIAYPAMLQRGQGVYCFEYGGPWLELGTPRDYLQANLDLLAGRRELSRARPPQLDLVRDGVLCAPGAIIEPGARLGPEVVLGEGCRAAASARAERVVAWPGCRLQGELQRAVVAGDDLVVRVN